MSTLVERGLNMLSRATPTAAGGWIIYQRGTDRVWIRATFGRSEFTVETTDSTRIEFSDRDFIVAAERLILAGQLATPQRGDRITVVEEEHGDGQVYEVLPIDGKQCYRTCDSTGHMIRVYTKKVSDG